MDQNFGKGNADRPGDPLPQAAGEHQEIAAAGIAANWQEKALTDFVTYPKKNQGANDSCMAQSGAKMIAVDNMNGNDDVYRELSPHSIYPFGFVPGGGMSGPSLIGVLTGRGVSLETLFPSYDASGAPLSEDAMRSSTGYEADAQKVATLFKSGTPIYCATDFDTIAGVLETYKQAGQKKVVRVSVIGSNNGTWWDVFPKPPGDPTSPDPQNDANPWYHSLVITDYGLVQGKKTLAIDNSWGEGPGQKGQQFLQENYQPKMYGSFYTVPAPTLAQQTGEKPRYTWNTDLSVGSGGNDVLALQKALQYLGMFPTDAVLKPTGYYGQLTKIAVELFQGTYGITPTSGYCGPLTRAHLNELFS